VEKTSSFLLNGKICIFNVCEHDKPAYRPAHDGKHDWILPEEYMYVDLYSRLEFPAVGVHLCIY
jgi:hypothetical protein